MLERIIVVIIMLGVISFITIRFIERPKHEINECIKEKELEFSGVVDTIIQDQKNRSQSTIFLTNGRKVLPDYTYGLWIEARAGDSIVKKKGTLNYLIYKGANERLLKKLRWNKNCDGQ